MLYGWIEVGLSNNTLFRNEADQDIIIRTIYDNKIILGNTNGVNADGAMYIKGNNVGIYKVPNSNVSLDVNGFTVLKSAQVGYSNLPTELVMNGRFVMKDVAKDFASNMEMLVTNSNNVFNMKYNDIQRIQVTDGNGITMNDNVYIINDVYANAFQLTSDIRLKSNVIDSDKEGDINILRHIDIKDYDIGGRRTKGFIAQNVETVFPGAVLERRGGGGGGAGGMGGVEGVCGVSAMKTIDTNQLLAVNTSVLKSLLERVEALERLVGKRE
jgi:hypothetical protein